MAVHVACAAAKRLPLRERGLHGNDLGHRPVDLRIVAADEHHEAVQIRVCGERRRLPDLTVLRLPVAEQRKRIRARAAQTVGQGEADGARQAALTERPEVTSTAGEDSAPIASSLEPSSP